MSMKASLKLSKVVNIPVVMNRTLLGVSGNTFTPVNVVADVTFVRLNRETYLNPEDQHSIEAPAQLPSLCQF